MADPAKTYHGVPCACGETLRWRCDWKCVACQRERSRLRRRHKRATDPDYLERARAQDRASYERKAGDHLRWNGMLLRERRRKALKRMEARHGQV